MVVSWDKRNIYENYFKAKLCNGFKFAFQEQFFCIIIAVILGSLGKGWGYAKHDFLH